MWLVFRYQEGWRRSSHSLMSPSQFTASQVMDLFGHEAERAWHRQRYEQQRARRYSPPDARPYRQQPMRSASHHNLHHPRYIAEMRFP